MKILTISGISGYNTGDVAISQCIYHQLINLGHEVEQVSPEPNEKIQIYSQKNESTILGKLKQIIKTNGISIIYIYGIFKTILYRIPYILKRARDKDYVIIGGGNLISNDTGSYYLFLFSMISFILKKKVILWGVGVGPFSYSYKNQLSLIHRNVKLLCVRDEKSKQYFNKGGILVINDPAFLISDVFTQNSLETQQYLGFNIMDYSHDEKLLKKLDIKTITKNIIEISNKYGLTPILIVTSISDLPINELIKGNLQNKYNINIEIKLVEINADLPLLMSRMKLILAHRMHCGIMGMSYNVPVMLFEWQEKVTSMLNYTYSNKFRKLTLVKNINFSDILILEKDELKEISDYLKVKIPKIKTEIKQQTRVLLNCLKSTNE